MRERMHLVETKGSSAEHASMANFVSSRERHVHRHNFGDSRWGRHILGRRARTRLRATSSIAKCCVGAAAQHFLGRGKIPFRLDSPVRDAQPALVSALTQQRLAWRPTGPGLLAELAQMDYGSV